jgi:hypothetical protein
VARGLEAEEVTAVTEPEAADPNPAEPSPGSRRTPRPLALATELPDRVDSWLEARRRVAWALSAVLLGLVAIIVVVPAATGPGGVSPIDEYDYTDALDKADHGELSNTGDKIDQYARQVVICRGLLAITPPAPDACGMPQSDTAVPRDGFSAADIHPPTYFFLTAAVSKVVRALGLTDDLLIAGRLVGALWLTLGMLAMVGAGRAWGARWVMPVLTAVAIGASPLLVSVSGYLTPDAMGLLVGAGVLLATTLWQRGRLHWALLLLTALMPAFVKVPFVLAPLFGAVLLLVAGLAGHTPWRRALTGGVILVGGAGAGAVLCQLIRGALAVGVPTLHPEGPPVALSEFVRFFGYYLEMVPLTSGAPIPVSTLLVVAVKPLAWLLLAAALGGMVFRRREDPLLPVAWAGFTGMVLGSIVLSLIVLIASGGLLIGQSRYALGLLPLYAVPLMCTRHPVAVWGLAAAAGASVLSHLLLW